MKRELQEDKQSALQNVAKKLKTKERHAFKRKGNEQNFKHGEAVEAVLGEAMSSLERNNLQQVEETLEQGKVLALARKMEIVLAD